MTLHYDYARCNGYQTQDGWRDGCEDCLRRTSPGREHYQPYILPPTIIVFECESRIAPGELK